MNNYVSKVVTKQFWDKNTINTKDRYIYFRNVSDNIFQTNIKSAGQIPIRKPCEISRIYLMTKNQEIIKNSILTLNIHGNDRYQWIHFKEDEEYPYVNVKNMPLGAGQSFNICLDLNTELKEDVELTVVMEIFYQKDF